MADSPGWKDHRKEEEAFNKKNNVKAMEDLDIDYLQRETLFQLESVLVEETKAHYSKEATLRRRRCGLDGVQGVINKFG